MSIPVRAISPEALSVARRLYETTNMPMRHIADTLGIAKTTLSRRVKLLGWQPRRHRIALAAPPRDVPPPELPGPAGPPLGEAAPFREAVPRGVLIARLVAQVETEIAAIERLVARAGDDRVTAGIAEAERAARTLAILVRSLRELVALEKNEPGEDDDAAQRDADAFRRELGATLERVLAGGAPG